MGELLQDYLAEAHGEWYYLTLEDPLIKVSQPVVRGDERSIDLEMKRINDYFCLRPF